MDTDITRPATAATSNRARWFVSNLSHADAGSTVLEGTPFANRLVGVYPTPAAAEAAVREHNEGVEKPRPLSRRAILKGVARVGAGLMAGGAVGMASSADLFPAGKEQATDPRILAAYRRWLHDELRLLEHRMDHTDLYPWSLVPAGTAVDTWHSGFLAPRQRAPGHGPNEAPEKRAARVLTAAGVDLGYVQENSRWEPRPGICRQYQASA